ncbi:group III truncated hemoglobin [Noviherbaspirillum sp.]|uniref:group III truncated hemoglobin n=1 Tax=Noviherbaspirillum sp. TaxID=1926288 RepID=UPI002FE27F46
MKVSTITEAMIRTMVDRFYAQVRRDDVLSGVFNASLDGRWEPHLDRMVAFWTKVLMGTGEFQSDVFGKHMALQGIEQKHFSRWLMLFEQTVNDIYSPDDAQIVMEVANRIARSLRYGYFREHATLQIHETTI